MNELGSYLKQQRLRCKLSLKKVYEQSGITDSKLSRFERGQGNLPNPPELIKLSRLYGISIISLYITAGYLRESDLSEYQYVFKNADLLSEEETQNIQAQINLFTRGRRTINNDI